MKYWMDLTRQDNEFLNTVQIWQIRLFVHYQSTSVVLALSTVGEDESKTEMSKLYIKDNVKMHMMI